MMVLVLNDFDYKGHHFKKLEVDLTNVRELKAVFDEQIIPYVHSELDLFM